MVVTDDFDTNCSRCCIDMYNADVCCCEVCGEDGMCQECLDSHICEEQ